MVIEIPRRLDSEPVRLTQDGRPRATRTLEIAMIGTRGVPASYGGFETAVEEIGRRLVERGHGVTVYTRGSESRAREYLGMKVVHLPALRVKQLETLSHTGLSAVHAVFGRRPDAAFVFNAANSPFLPAHRAGQFDVQRHAADADLDTAALEVAPANRISSPGAVTRPRVVAKSGHW